MPREKCPLIQNLDDLCESQSELFKRQNAMQVRQLIHRIEPIAGLRINMNRLEEPDLVVVAQGGHRYLGQPGKIANL